MKGHSFLSLVPALLGLSTAVTAAGLTTDSLTTYVDSATLGSSFNPVIAAYWTGYAHHRRTPFAVSSSGNSAYLAYLDSSGTNVHVQPIDPTTFEATGTATTVSGGKEAGGLVAHDDGFALLTNEAMPDGTTNAPPDSTPVPVLYRYDASGTQQWKTWLAGPDVENSGGHMCAPDMNGDLVYSNATGRYAAYFVVTAYDGDYSGHYGDSIQYVEEASGDLVSIDGASSDWGCSHNTGIALEAADEAPYASVCAEDQGAVWLNSNGQGMTTVGTKISNENTTNGAGGESMGGMSGSYSNLARFQDADGYIFAWVSRGAVELSENTWMGTGYTAAANRTNGRNVAIATFTDKTTMVQDQASSTVGAEGDSQVNWLTTSTTADQSNAHVATFDATTALVTWEEIADPLCEYIAFGCRGTFTGSYFQLVSNTDGGAAVGEPLQMTDVTVSGDLVTMPDGRICWPYVNQDWDMSQVVDGYGGSTTSTVTKMSFACISADGTSSSSSSGSTGSTGSSASGKASSSAAAVTSSAAPTSSSADAAVAAAASVVPSSPAAVVTPSAYATTSTSAAVAAPPAATGFPSTLSTVFVTASSEAAPVETSAADDGEACDEDESASDSSSSSSSSDSSAASSGDDSSSEAAAAAAADTPTTEGEEGCDSTPTASGAFSWPGWQNAIATGAAGSGSDSGYGSGSGEGWSWPTGVPTGDFGGQGGWPTAMPTGGKGWGRGGRGGRHRPSGVPNSNGGGYGGGDGEGSGAFPTAVPTAGAAGKYKLPVYGNRRNVN